MSAAVAVDVVQLRDDVANRQIRTAGGRGVWTVDDGDLHPLTRWPEPGEIVFTARNVFAVDPGGELEPLGPSAVCAAIRLLEELLRS